MKYLNHKEFARLLCLSQSAFCDKVSKGAAPRHCKMMPSSRGAKGKLWSEMKVTCFMYRLIEQAEKLKNEGYFQKHNSAMGFARVTLRRILKLKETPATNKISNFELFMQTSSKLNKGIRL